MARSNRSTSNALKFFIFASISWLYFASIKTNIGKPFKRIRFGVYGQRSGSPASTTSQPALVATKICVFDRFYNGNNGRNSSPFVKFVPTGGGDNSPNSTTTDQTCWPRALLQTQRAEHGLLNNFNISELSGQLTECGVTVVPSDCDKLLTAITWLKPEAIQIVVPTGPAVNISAQLTTSLQSPLCFNSVFGLFSEAAAFSSGLRASVDEFVSPSNIVVLNSPTASFNLVDLLSLLVVRSAVPVYHIDSNICVNETNELIGTPVASITVSNNGSALTSLSANMSAPGNDSSYNVLLKSSNTTVTARNTSETNDTTSQSRNNNCPAAAGTDAVFDDISSQQVVLAVVQKRMSWQALALLRRVLPVVDAEQIKLIVFITQVPSVNAPVSESKILAIRSMFTLLRQELAPIEQITIVELGLRTPNNSLFLQPVVNYLVSSRGGYANFSGFYAWLQQPTTVTALQSSLYRRTIATPLPDMFARLWYSPRRAANSNRRVLVSTMLDITQPVIYNQPNIIVDNCPSLSPPAVQFRDALVQLYALANETAPTPRVLNSASGTGADSSGGSSSVTVLSAARTDTAPASSGSPTTVVFVILALGIFILICSLVFKAITRCNRQAELEKVIADRTWWRIEPRELHLEDKKRGVINSSVFNAELSKSGKRVLHDGLELSSALHRGKLYVVRVCILQEGAARGTSGSNSNVIFTTKVLHELKVLTEMRHDNLARFIGICEMENKYIFVWEHGQHGTLAHVLANYNLELDWAFKLGFCLDISSGINVLHKSSIKFHANLRSTNCLVSSNFIVKVSDFGLQSLRGQLQNEWNGDDSIQNDRSLLWKAPEFLRHPNPHSVWNGSQKGDMWSFGIVMQEIALRVGPYDNSEISVMEFEPRDIIAQLRSRRHDQHHQFRPHLAPGACPEDYRYLMDFCLEEYARNRPSSFTDINKMLLAMIENEKHGVTERNVELHRLSKYTKNLEELVKERTKEMAKARQLHASLLEWLVPQPVLHRMMTTTNNSTNGGSAALTVTTLAPPPMVTITSPAATSPPANKRNKSPAKSPKTSTKSTESRFSVGSGGKMSLVAANAGGFTRIGHMPIVCLPELYNDVTFMVVRFPQVIEMAALACTMAKREDTEAFVLVVEKLNQLLLNLIANSNVSYVEWLSTPDKYVFVCGAPKRIGSRHAQEVLALACRTKQCLQSFELQMENFEAALLPPPPSSATTVPASTNGSVNSSDNTLSTDDDTHHRPQDLATLVTTTMKLSTLQEQRYSTKHLLPRIGINSGRAVDLVVGKKHCKYTIMSTALQAAEIIANHAGANEILVSVNTINALPPRLRVYKSSPDGFSKQYIDVQLEATSISSSPTRATLLPKFDVKMHSTNDYYFTYSVAGFST